MMNEGDAKTAHELVANALNRNKNGVLAHLQDRLAGASGVEGFAALACAFDDAFGEPLRREVNTAGRAYAQYGKHALFTTVTTALGGEAVLMLAEGLNTSPEEVIDKLVERVLKEGTSE